VETAISINKKLFDIAFTLSVITIGYNLAEGVISTFFGYQDDTLALFGFGVDSFIEVISAVGIAHMIRRIRDNQDSDATDFERQALRVTGTAFYLLTLGLVIGAILNIVTGAVPDTTLPGIIISLVSIGTMYLLFHHKIKVGRKLNSPAIISDANCTKTCFYLSFILLTASLVYELFGIMYIDAIGSLGIAWFAFSEGKEAFEKAANKNLVCGDDCCD